MTEHEPIVGGAHKANRFSITAATFSALLAGLLVMSALGFYQNQELKQRLRATTEERDRTETLLETTQETLDILLRRIKQLERFIRGLGFEPPSSTQSSSQAGDGSDSGPSDEGPKPEDPPGGPNPKPSPSPSPTDPGPFAEVCDLVPVPIPVCT